MVAVPVELLPEGPGYDPEQLAVAVALVTSGLDRKYEWRRDALCREHPELNWFPTRGERTVEVARVCSKCLVSC